MLALCGQYAQAHGIQFNADKTQLICFRRTAASDHTHFSLCGQCPPMVDSVIHLGNTLQYHLSDKLDIHLKSMAFICQANSFLFRFKECDPQTKMKLFDAFCLLLYGCAVGSMPRTSNLFVCHLTMLSDEFGIFHTIAIRLLPMLSD